MVRVKICGLTRIQDAEHAIEMGADALGFVFEPASPRYVGGHASELIDRVEPYVMCVGVFGQFHSVDVANLNCVQFSDLGGTTSLTASIGISSMPPVIRTLRVRAGEEPKLVLKLLDDWLTHFRINPRGILLDAYDERLQGGTGKSIDWDLAAEIVRHSSRPVILAGGLTPDNVAAAIEAVRPYAVDVSSGVESSPGIKDPAKVRDFIQAAKGG